MKLLTAMLVLCFAGMLLAVQPLSAGRGEQGAPAALDSRRESSRVAAPFAASRVDRRCRGCVSLDNRSRPLVIPLEAKLCSARRFPQKRVRVA